MAVLGTAAAPAAPADPEDFVNLGEERVDMNRFKGVFPPHIKCIAVLTPASEIGRAHV